jgi:hemerythrin superfamily protein
MVVILDNTKRNAIAVKLADMKLLQQLIIDNEELFLRECKNEEITNSLRSMLEDDRKNQEILDTIVVQYGIQKEAESKIQEMVKHIYQLMESRELTLFDKIFEHELLKHQQVMNGITIHKAAQKVGLDVIATLGHLNTINFENRAHQEQLKGILEILGVWELTGQEADQGIWGRVQDAISAISGAVGSAFSHSSEKQDMNIQDFIRMDHNKINILFTELLHTNDPAKIQEYFAQIYQDLSVHTRAEEEVLYPRIRSFYGEANTQKLYDEHSRWGLLFDEVRVIDISTPEFKNKMRQMWEEIGNHFRQEENTMFTAIHNNMNDEEHYILGNQFKVAKTRIQAELEGITTEATV